MRIEQGGYSDREDGVKLAPLSDAETVVSPNSTQFTVTLTIDNPRVPRGTKLFLRFVVTYRDILQKPADPPHVTTFCGFYPPDDSADDRTTFMSCPHGGNSMN
jgi:hypothetical protein